MKVFTIENDTNNITLHGSIQEAEAVPNAGRFRNEAALAKLATGWPTARLVEVWNSLPRQTPVKKFKDRATAVNRIWSAIQNLGSGDTIPAAAQAEPEAVIPEPEVVATVAPQAPDVAPEAAPSGNKAARATKAPKPAAVAGQPREGSKTSQVIALLKREDGTTLEEIMTAMGWQKHTTRAMLSAGGSLTKNHGLVIASEKVGDKRVYSIKA